MSKIFVTSDLHFGHENIIRLGKGRPFATIEEHNQTLIDNWNSVVSNEDLVYILGDIYIGVDGEYLEKLFRKLNGSIHVIAGNHDRKKELAYLLNKNLIQSLRDYHELRYRGIDDKIYRFVMCHYPILEFNGAYKSGNKSPTYIHLYGHIHNMVNYDDIYKRLGFKAYHVGVDTNSFTPVCIDDIIDYFKQQINE
jgi:calcineurin-like phosphoesterase family protein